ncbi:MAG: hypothetical protein HZA08_07395 [Nitrospirae bacterium]|nr:hypothetical protein [Nitrospirota bacterium]
MPYTECKPYDAYIPQSVCDARKKKAMQGDVEITYRKCQECQGGEIIVDTDKEVLKCKTCGSTEEKRFHKALQECGKCYDKRWKAEHAAKQNIELPKEWGTVKQPVPVTVPVTVRPAPTLPKENGHILLLDFREYDGWYDTLKEIATEEMRTPANMVMYWIRGHLKKGGT